MSNGTICIAKTLEDIKVHFMYFLSSIQEKDTILVSGDYKEKMSEWVAANIAGTQVSQDSDESCALDTRNSVILYVSNATDDLTNITGATLEVGLPVFIGIVSNSDIEAVNNFSSFAVNNLSRIITRITCVEGSGTYIKAFTDKSIEEIRTRWSRHVQVNIVKLRDDAILPKYAQIGDAGADLFLPKQEEAKIIKPGERVLIKTGLAIELPVGFEAQVRSKSGLAINRGIFVLNSPGTVDEQYRGEIGIIIYNSDASPMTFNGGDKLAQLVIKPAYTADFNEVNNLTTTARGTGGFGSTGR